MIIEALCRNQHIEAPRGLIHSLRTPSTFQRRLAGAPNAGKTALMNALTVDFIRNYRALPSLFRARAK